MALDALRCNHLAPLGFKGLKHHFADGQDQLLDLEMLAVRTHFQKGIFL